MRRPLLFGCVSVLATISIWNIFSNAPPEEKITTDIITGQEITIIGQVYQKKVLESYGQEKLQIYLKQIKILEDSSNYQKLPNYHSINYNLICEIDMVDEPNLGARVRLSGTFQLYSTGTNPGEFNAARFYAIQDVVGKIKGAKIEVATKSYHFLPQALYELKMYWKDRLFQCLPEKEASILLKMLLGDGSLLDDEIKEMYMRNGVIHILSISGLHITMIGLGLYKGLRKLAIPIVPAAITGAILIFLYGMMTGFGLSAIRAIGMYLIKMLGEMWGKSYDMLTAMGILAVVMVINNPDYLYHSGFWLSFGSVCGIGVLYPVLSQSHQRNTKYPDNKKFYFEYFTVFLNNIRILAKENFFISLSITLFTLPIQLYFFYQIPTYSIFLNMLILPLMGFVMIGGLFVMLLPGGEVTGLLAQWILGWYESLCIAFEQLPMHILIVGRPSWWKIIVYYSLLFLLIGIGSSKKRNVGKTKNTFEISTSNKKEVSYKDIKSNRRNTVNIKENIKSNRRNIANVKKDLSMYGRSLWKEIWYHIKLKYKYFTVVLMIAIVLMPSKKEFKISFLDVGQGDCILVETKEGQIFLFDGGSSSKMKVGTNIIIPFLKYYGIGKIDAIFISHPDKDHYNGIMELLTDSEGIEIGQVYLPKVSKSVRERDMSEIIEIMGVNASRGKNIPLGYLSIGDEWKHGGTEIICMHPTKDFVGESNTYSECFYIKNENTRVLLTGDVEGAGEKIFLQNLKELCISDVSLLKVAHHGSKNSTSQEFIDVVNPKVSIISYGEGNSYGHPHVETLDRLENIGSKVMTTVEKGAIIITIEDGIKVYGFKE